MRRWNRNEYREQWKNIIWVCALLKTNLHCALEDLKSKTSSLSSVQTPLFYPI